MPRVDPEPAADVGLEQLVQGEDVGDLTEPSARLDDIDDGAEGAVVAGGFEEAEGGGPGDFADNVWAVS